jgi:hypothetical protein
MSGTANHIQARQRNQRKTTSDRIRDIPTVAPAGDGVESSGSWRRVDLHVHTPASTDYQDPSVTALQILKKAEERELDVLAFTDHNSVRGYADLWREIEDLELLEFLQRITPPEREQLEEYRRLLGKILLLPGFEFTATFGFHILAVFPEGTSVRKMEHLLLLLGVPEEKFGSGEVGATTDVLRAYETLDDAGALVVGAHVNSTHGIAMQGFPFGGQTKIAYTQNVHLHALEVTDLRIANHRRSTARFFDGSKPEYPRRMHCIQGSDAHRLDRDPKRETNLGVGERATEMLLASVSFQAIKSLLTSAVFEHTRPFFPIVGPADEIRAAREQGNTDSTVFHERYVTKRDGSAHILRDATALANHGGGSLYIGLSPHLRRPIAGIDDPERASDEVRSTLAEGIHPTLTVAIETVTVDGKNVLALRVPSGDQKPYAVASGSIYVRDQDASRLATRDEIVQMVLSMQSGLTSTLPTVEAEPIGKPDTRSTGARKDGRRRAPVSEGNGRPLETDSVTTAVPEPVLAPGTTRASDGTSTNGARGDEEWTEPDQPDEYVPATGVEVIAETTINGVRRFSLRDLRHRTVVHNVAPETSRKAWRYAIEQYGLAQPKESRIRWQGDYGFWKTYTPRGGDRRYNLVYRGDGHLRVFYAVTLDGLDQRWRAVLPGPKPSNKSSIAKSE